MGSQPQQTKFKVQTFLKTRSITPLRRSELSIGSVWTWATSLLNFSGVNLFRMPLNRLYNAWKMIITSLSLKHLHLFIPRGERRGGASEGRKGKNDKKNQSCWAWIKKTTPSWWHRLNISSSILSFFFFFFPFSFLFLTFFLLPCLSRRHGGISPL